MKDGPSRKSSKGLTLTSETELVAKVALRKYASEVAPYGQQKYYRLAGEIDRVLGMTSIGASKQKLQLNIHEAVMLYHALTYCGQPRAYQGTVTSQQFRELRYMLFGSGLYGGT